MRWQWSVWAGLFVLAACGGAGVSGADGQGSEEIRLSPVVDVAERGGDVVVQEDLQLPDQWAEVLDLETEDGANGALEVDVPEAPADSDQDGVPDVDDAFPLDPTEWADADGDGVGDNSDNCPEIENPGQEDQDFDDLGDLCDDDLDGDGVANGEDNCLYQGNGSQADLDGDGLGDACDSDVDGDGVLNGNDDFPKDPSEWLDSDGDGVGDNSDALPDDPNGWSDDDEDGVADQVDNCLGIPNPEQEDLDGDGVGDGCDNDDDNDGFDDVQDLFPHDPEEWADSDGDGVGDNGDLFPEDPTEWADGDGDGVGENSDNCVESFNPLQADADGDGQGDLCDGDLDGDGVDNSDDVFPEDPEEWADSDCDGAGDNQDPKPEDASCAGSSIELCNGEDDDCDGVVDELAGADAPCAGGCNPNTNLCIECGNGVLDPGEVCDDGNLEFGDACSPTCLSSGEDDNTVLVVAYINHSGYIQWGQELADGVAQAGGEVTYLLNPADGEVAAELAAKEFGQLWLYDLQSLGNTWPVDAAAMGAWHEAMPVRNVILDGRMTGDLWHPPTSRPLVENYYVNLKERGGGAVYLTDHDAFCLSMFNLVMTEIGYNGCFGKFYGDLPFDGENILMSYPNAIDFLYNDSSTGAVPVGPQPNGEILYSLAWYGGNPDTPAISTTIEGVVGFHVEIELPAPMKKIFPGDELVFSATQDGGTEPIEWTWESDQEGELGTGNPLLQTLTVQGNHFIELYAVDSLGHADTDVVVVHVMDPDPDNDAWEGWDDNCPFDDNSGQEDTDGDGMGDACDFDDDNDGICDPIDPNPIG